MRMYSTEARCTEEGRSLALGVGRTLLFAMFATRRPERYSPFAWVGFGRVGCPASGGSRIHRYFAVLFYLRLRLAVVVETRGVLKMQYFTTFSGLRCCSKRQTTMV